MISETMFIVWFSLIAVIGFLIGRQYEFHWMMNRFKELAEECDEEEEEE